MKPDQVMRATAAVLELSAVAKELETDKRTPLEDAMVRHIKGVVTEWGKHLQAEREADTV